MLKSEIKEALALCDEFGAESRIRPFCMTWDNDRGPYRLLRHPSYTGLLCTCLGIGLALGNWVALLLAIVPTTIAIVYRIRVEERALLAGIGEPYRQFCATRARLIPHVW